MKNKIKNLINEIGINKVESVLNQMKPKVNVKKQLKQDFIKLLDGCNISFDGDDIDYRQDGKLICYYKKNENIFRFEYSIWLNLESKYNLNHFGLKNLLVGIVEEVLSYKSVTLGIISEDFAYKWKRY